MPFLHKLLIRFKLRYQDKSQEHEYVRINIPILKDFLTFFVICMTVVGIPYTIHFFSLHLSSLAYAAISAIIILLLIFIFRNHLGRGLEYVVVLYLLCIVIIMIMSLSQVINTLRSCESFYLGYAFALLHRILGYRIVKVHFMVLFHLISLTLRFIMLHDHAISISLIVTAVEVFTIGVSVKSEMIERKFFDSLYQSKMQLVKFKDFLTEHLPNPMVILSKDYSKSFFMNEAFKQYFQCENISQVKEALSRLYIDKETIDKDSCLSMSNGHLMSGHLLSPKEQLNFSTFLSSFSERIEHIKTSDILTFHVYDGEKEIMPNSNRNSEREDRLGSYRGSPLTPSKFKRHNRVPGARKTTHVFSFNPAEFSETSGRDININDGKSDFVEEKPLEEQRRIFEVKMFLLPWGGTDAIALILNDVTQQRTIMELRVADKNKDLVIATVSHELRTPLNGILGIIEIIKKMVDDSEVLSYLNACKNSGVFLLNMVNSTLDMSQIKHNKFKLVYTKVNIPTLMDELHSLFESFLITKSLFLNIDIAKNAPKTIITDRNRLSQILINLLGNAFKFTYEGGVTVKVEFEKRVPQIVRFSIKDTGLGIDRDDQKKLFKLFGRLEQQDKKVNTSGVGLGLTISNTLAVLLNPIEKQGIHLESEPGRGSTFSFSVELQGNEILDRGESDISFPEENEHMKTPISHNGMFSGIDEDRQSVYVTAKVENFDRMRDSRKLMSEDQELRVSPMWLHDSSLKLKKNFSTMMSHGTSFHTKRKSTPLLRKLSSSRKSEGYISDSKLSEYIPERQGSEKWCLIVDDNPFNLMVARHIMEERDYNILSAMNGQEAVNQAQEHHAQGKTLKVILMDCQMPVMDGYEATKVLTEMMRNGEVGQCPIFALTANMRDDNHEERWKESGMSGSIAKPLQIKELEKMLRKAVKTSMEKL